MRIARSLTLVAVTAALTSACYKGASASADSTASSSTATAKSFDKALNAIDDPWRRRPHWTDTLKAAA